MKEVSKIKFRPEHLMEIGGAALHDAAVAHSRNGPALAFMVDGEIAAVGGYIVLWAGTAETWVCINPKYLRCPSVFVEIKRQMEAWITEGHFSRMQAMTREDWGHGRRFLEWLGMQYEGTLRKMGPGGIDQVVYARVT